jgi:exo-beta-1,3-glucanase (GH17 family)
MTYFLKRLLLLVATSILLIYGQTAHSREHLPKHGAAKKAQTEALQCVAFSPYVGSLNPDYGVHPSKELINQLLDTLIKKTRFRCIMTYGVLNGLDYTFAAAQARKIKVIAILWLDKDAAVNSQSIAKGIEVAKAYPKTIIKLSCGSEVRTRHGYAFDGEIDRCMDSLRLAGVKQPITTIDTWWEWCNRAKICGQTSFGAKADWIGINIFPWWESIHSSIHTCIPANKAADFHIARMDEVRHAYPKKEVIVTEFGWPNGPEGHIEANKNTQERCAMASPNNQTLVVQATFKKLKAKGWSGIVFEAFSENWKPSNEGNVGRFWGICQGEPPFACNTAATASR